MTRRAGEASRLARRVAGELGQVQAMGKAERRLGRARGEDCREGDRERQEPATPRGTNRAAHGRLRAGKSNA